MAGTVVVGRGTTGTTTSRSHKIHHPGNEIPSITATAPGATTSTTVCAAMMTMAVAM
jgi:hypothetical protein